VVPAGSGAWREYWRCALLGLIDPAFGTNRVLHFYLYKGMCACRCSGSTAVRYGSMRENVLNVTAVLPDGTIIKTGSRARKSSAGYDITRLLIGSEGTLAVITEVTLKLHGIPRVSHAVRISFPGGVKDAAMMARDTLNCGVTVGRCELLDDTMVKIINQANPHNPQGPWLESTTLLYELTGISEQAVAEQRDVVTAIARKHGGTAIYTATSEEETRQFWKFRKECLWSAMSQYPDYEPMITDVCVPLTKLPDLIHDTKLRIEKSGLPCPIIAHAG
jgi:D-lactate dehydrogenase (cytochrome)